MDYTIIAFKFMLSFGINIKHVSTMPIYSEETKEGATLGDFDGLVINLPFIEILVGSLCDFMRLQNPDHTESKDHLEL